MLKHFKGLQVVIVIFCVTGPLILKLLSNEQYYPVNVRVSSTVPTNSEPARISSVQNGVKGLDSFRIFTVHAREGGSVDMDDCVQLDKYKFRLSISDYARSSVSYLFGWLYGVAGMLFIYNGFFFYSNKVTFTDSSDGKGLLSFSTKGTWYNIVLGLLLFLVIVFPTYHFPLLHIIVSVLFVAFNIVILATFSIPGERLYKHVRRLMAFLVILIFVLHFVHEAPFHPTILWGEWITLILVSIHMLVVLFKIQAASYQYCISN